MSSLQKSILKSRLPPIHPMQKKEPLSGRKRDYSATHWNKYFADRDYVNVDRGNFRLYLSPALQTNDAPLLIMLHGGGYSALTWCHFCSSVTEVIDCQVIALDLRGHGETTTSDDADLSADSLSLDVAEVITKYIQEKKLSSNIFLVGHSMGGAIAVHVASRGLLDDYLIGLAVIDVVEGTALDALASMQSFLRSRPKYFRSIEHAIEWSVRGGQIRNLDSAKVSMQGQIVKYVMEFLIRKAISLKTGQLAAAELWDNLKSNSTENDSGTTSSDVNHFNTDCILEEDSDTDQIGNSQGTSQFKTPPSPIENQTDEKRYGWRINLSQTEQHWSGWFNGLSNMFLEVPVPKLLLLASIDGLDRTLTVGQMQGKFQMKVLSRCGHAVQEDKPHEVADVISQFLIRHKFAKPKIDVQVNAVK